MRFRPPAPPRRWSRRSAERAWRRRRWKRWGTSRWRSTGSLPRCEPDGRDSPLPPRSRVGDAQPRAGAAARGLGVGGGARDRPGHGGGLGGARLRADARRPPAEPGPDRPHARGVRREPQRRGRAPRRRHAGAVGDHLVDAGGTVILAETTELIGAEHLLARRAASPQVAEAIYTIIHRYEAVVRAHGEDIRGANPAPGNIEGGLTTIEEKSLGAAKKGGTRTIREVVEYAVRPAARWLVIMDTPGSDIEQTVGMVAGW